MVWCSPGRSPRRGELAIPAHRADHSLERDYPEVYKALLEIARNMVTEHEYDARKFQFTFKSASADDLYILPETGNGPRKTGKDTPLRHLGSRQLSLHFSLSLGETGWSLSSQAPPSTHQRAPAQLEPCVAAKHVPRGGPVKK